jgi:hypothetical protein
VRLRVYDLPWLTLRACRCRRPSGRSTLRGAGTLSACWARRSGLLARAGYIQPLPDRSLHDHAQVSEESQKFPGHRPVTHRYGGRLSLFSEDMRPVYRR